MKNLDKYDLGKHLELVLVEAQRCMEECVKIGDVKGYYHYRTVEQDIMRYAEAADITLLTLADFRWLDAYNFEYGY